MAETIGGDCHSSPDQVAAQPDDLLVTSAPNPVENGYTTPPVTAGAPAVIVAESKQQPATPVGSARLNLLCISRT